MRIWSIHPRYLDAKGLVACWREGLLARKVLQGLTKGYRNHPQLERFKLQANPLEMIDTYLLGIYEEAILRDYNFNREKIGLQFSNLKIEVSDGQLRFEINHLKKKLETRDGSKYAEIANINAPEPHSIFRVVLGDIETWER